MQLLTLLNNLFGILNVTCLAEVKSFVAVHRFSVGIYIIYFVDDTGKLHWYIGSSFQMGVRIMQHIKAAKNGKKGYLYNSLIFHGVNNFSIAVLDLCPGFTD